MSITLDYVVLPTPQRLARMHRTDSPYVCFHWNKEPTEDDRERTLQQAFPQYEHTYQAYDAHEHALCPVCKWYGTPGIYGPSHPEVLLDAFSITLPGGSHDARHPCYLQEEGVQTVTRVLPAEVDDLQELVFFLNKWKDQPGVQVLCLKDP